MGQGPFVKFVQRVANGLGMLPGQSVVWFDPASFTTTDNPSIVTQGPPGAEGIATGRTEVRISVNAEPIIRNVPSGTGTRSPLLYSNPSASQVAFSAIYINPFQNLAANDTDYYQISLVTQAIPIPGFPTTLAVITSKTSGSGGTGSWAANRLVTLSGTLTVPASTALYLLIEPQGAAGALAIDIDIRR